MSSQNDLVEHIDVTTSEVFNVEPSATPLRCITAQGRDTGVTASDVDEEARYMG